MAVTVVSLPSEPRLPDAVFVEDPAVVLDELAVVTTMGSDKRREEVQSLISVLSQYRPLEFLREPAMLEGGDVLRVNRTLYVGLSSRTNKDGITQLCRIVQPYGYNVKSVDVKGCLHLKTGCTYIGENTILANPSWVDLNEFKGFKILEVPRTEPWAANALLVRQTILFPNSFPQTSVLMADEGFNLRQVDISELLKAEAGLTCMSIIFESTDSTS
jgi:dimethylargininase